ncbi:hypothetical protein [Micromonospora tarensis]|uniref:Uncharacterized protein n=1 Tax=Micromonospora tarensis TaxID=2806100 RepID=A0ABS1YD78_9ACTN|nr:hypothetical protein [Micromonospora tarensis]MBM0275359.1 hypothetical protein [Micromonospora tarensis]
MNLDAIAAALHTAMPVLAAVVYPPLLITAGVSAWYRSLPDPEVRTTAPKPATADAGLRRLRQDIDGPTQVIRRSLPDAGAPIYAELSARHTAEQWLRELGQRAHREVSA